MFVVETSETCNNVHDSQTAVDEVHPQQTEDGAPERPPFIDIVPVTAVEPADADAEIADISARMDLGVPAISVQVASPMAVGPGEEEEQEGGLCSAMEKYAHAWTGNFDIEDAEDNGDDGKKCAVNGRTQQYPEDADNEDDAEDDRPLSPTDYTLEDESDVTQLDGQDVVYHPMLLDCRAPSPSEFSLLTESAEENELHRLTQTAVTDDVFAIPDPSPSSAEINMYLAMQYDQLERQHHADTASNLGTKAFNM